MRAKKDKLIPIDKFTDIPGMNHQLLDHFKKLKDPSYKGFEISFLMQQYDWTTHPLAEEIKKLLAATITFRKATDVSEFKNARNLNLNKKELLNILNQMATALHHARIIKNSKDIQAYEKKVLTHAINYALKSVKKRLNELKLIDDKLYDLYLHDAHNNLKSELQ